jgi:two-component system, response regulator
MNQFDAIEILIVDDNPNDAELTVRALKEQNLANQLFVAGSDCNFFTGSP